jgi:D-alanyl-lipoteichoic acid acyltransferase DltB (MBOAT superfamily)
MSVLFYAYGEPKFVFVMLFSILMNWLFGLMVHYFKKKNVQEAARVVIAVMVVFNIALFFVFKYLNFAIRNINNLFGDVISQTNIVLPIGISFFTFQAMSYVFDVYRGRGDVQKNPLNTALYITFFPQLIAGPIVRYETVSKEINSRVFNSDDFLRGVQRFIIGLAKKAILANSVAVVADWAFKTEGLATLPILGAWLGVIAYTLQIYFDFSGYSDMAIGMGLMFGFHFNENFNYPYISKSITEFWRRWHISLGSWFRDYVYFPMGGSRVKTQSRLIFNLFVVWTLTGVWHGANWQFAFWGFLYFVLIAFEKLTDLPKKLEESGNFIMIQLYRIFTLLAVMIGWVFFRADGLKNGVKYLLALFGLKNNAPSNETAYFLLKENAVIFLIGIIASTPIVKILFQKTESLFRDNIVVFYCKNALLLALFIVAASFTISSSYNPFIYFNF